MTTTPPRRVRSSSLSRGTTHSIPLDDYPPPPPLRDPYSESSPLAYNSSPDLSNLPSATFPLSPNDSDASSNTAYGDQPYGHRTGAVGSLDLADATYATMMGMGNNGLHQASPLPSPTSTANHQTKESFSSRTPIHPGATVGFGTSAAMRSGRTAGGEKSGYRSPRAHSRERSQGGGLGNWQGPAGVGQSPYGPLGSGNGGNGSGFNSAANSNPNLLFAEGDAPITVPTNIVSRFLLRVFNSNFVIRWIIYILPLLGLLWIPGVVGVTVAPKARVWGVPLLWWSVWLSLVWCGWWGAALVARLGPKVLMNTLGAVAPEMKHYIIYVGEVRFYTGAAGWALADWIAFSPLVTQRATDDNSKTTLSLCTQGLFGIFIVLVILLLEKLVIQIIAHNFHKKSYEDRILQQKFQIRILTALYLNSHDVGRRDTLDGQYPLRPGAKRHGTDPTLLVKKALHGARRVAQSATTLLGTVASEIAGERVMQPNSPSSMVTNALSSANKTKQLARRIYFSFCPSYRTALLLEDVGKCFESRTLAEQAFAIFDRDLNGDATLEEIEMSCLEIHRERLALSNSMRDLDSAVGNLDGILMSLWYVVAIIIIVGLLDASFNTMVASAGTLILGLSWMIGTTAQEILAAIIFLFVKHAYDCGDRVDIDAVSYVVVEMSLLSTIFRRVDGVMVQAPHSLLNTKFINNIRRSGATTETFTWDVAFDTTFEKIQALRNRMMEFLEIERRDFLPKIDIAVKDFEGQGKMTLSANIAYKGNWQNGALTAQRRNKWCCALKLAMASLEIWGPAGAGNPAPDFPDPTPYTLIPYEEILAKKDAAEKEALKEVTKKDVIHSGDGIEGLRSRRGVVEDLESENAIRDRSAGSEVTESLAGAAGIRKI